MRHIIWFPVLVLSVGCNLGGKKSGSGQASASAAAPAAAAAAGGNELAEVNLDPLPLKIQVKPGGMGAMDMSVADKKSVTVDVGEGASLNIKPEEESFAEVKKGYEKDKMLFPFKKWEKEADNLAIMQFENEGKSGYIGLMLVDVGGQSYVCKTTGLDGVASVEAAQKQLQACKALAAK